MGTLRIFRGTPPGLDLQRNPDGAARGVTTKLCDASFPKLLCKLSVGHVRRGTVRGALGGQRNLSRAIF